MSILLAKDGSNRYLLGEPGDSGPNRMVRVADLELGKVFPPKPLSVANKFNSWQPCEHSNEDMRRILKSVKGR